MKLTGKGLFIWQIPYCEGGKPAAIAARAKQAGLTHVLIKIADGANWPYNVDSKTDRDLIPPVLTALKAAGIQVWGWHYVRGDNPLGEARLGGQRARALGVDGYVIDAEREYKRSGRKEAARRYVQELRRQLPEIPLALSSYRYPRLHYEVPYSEFLAVCDYAMPQVYFEHSHNPEVQLQLCMDQYMSLPNARPIVPTFPAYSIGGWKPTTSDIHRAMDKAKSFGMKAANAWSWDFASRPDFQDLWQAWASYTWQPAPPPADLPDKLIRRLNQGKPDELKELYNKNAAHVTGERTILGRAEIKKWYKHLLKETLPKASFELTGINGAGTYRQFTWTATSSKGRVLDGNDTLGILDGEIHYHYTNFHLSP